MIETINALVGSVQMMQRRFRSVNHQMLLIRGQALCGWAVEADDFVVEVRIRDVLLIGVLLDI